MFWTSHIKKKSKHTREEEYRLLKMNLSLHVKESTKYI